MYGKEVKKRKEKGLEGCIEGRKGEKGEGFRL